MFLMLSDVMFLLLSDVADIAVVTVAVGAAVVIAVVVNVVAVKVIADVAARLLFVFFVCHRTCARVSEDWVCASIATIQYYTTAHSSKRFLLSSKVTARTNHVDIPQHASRQCVTKKRTT